jgi:hypothetical protein
MIRKASAAAVLAFATAGSALFGGAALAHQKGTGHGDEIAVSGDAGNVWQDCDQDAENSIVFSLVKDTEQRNSQLCSQIADTSSNAEVD